MRAAITALGLWLAGPLALAAPAGPEDAALDAVRRGDLATADRLSSDAVSAPGALAKPWSVRGYVLSVSGRKEQALDAYARAAALEPKDALVRTNRGCVLLDLERYAEAVDAFAQALAVDPGYARAENNRGVALERLGRFDEARAAYRRAIELSPRDAVAYNNLGALALRRGADGPAAARFAKAMELDPRFDAPVANLALVALARGDAKGEAELLAVGERPGASTSVRAKARAVAAAKAAREGRLAEAKAIYLELVRESPGDVDALNNLAVLEDRMGAPREALGHLHAALEVDPRNLVVQNNLGIVHVHRGDYARAEEVFRDVLRADPRFHRAHFNLGVVLGAQGDRRGALAAFRKAASLAPQDASAVYNIGLMARDAGADVAAERSAYERALQLDPALTEAHLALGSLLADPATPAPLRDEARARTHLRRFLELAYPDDVSGRSQANEWLSWLDRSTSSGSGTGSR